MAEWKPRVLVVGPGGLKGFCELGALDYLHYKTTILSECKTFVGVSVGAIISLLYVVGYEPRDIVLEMMDLKIDPSLSSLSIEDIIHQGGLFPQTVIEEQLMHLVKKKLGYVPSLKRLNTITGKEFGCVAYNQTKNRSEYLSHKTTADMNCVKAVQLSCNLPGFFQRQSFRDDEFRDGAICDPYPLKRFDDGATPILGIWVSTIHTSTHSKDIRGIIDEALRYVMLLINNLRDAEKKELSDNCKHLEITTIQRNVIAMSVNCDAVASMLLEGFESAEEFSRSIGHSMLITPIDE